MPTPDSRQQAEPIVICTDPEYTDTQMASKTISLKESTYNELARAKGDGESFSDVVDRLLGAQEEPLDELVDLLDDEAVETVRERSHAFRGDIDDRLGVGDGE